jgi:hypothetical protein
MLPQSIFLITTATTTFAGGYFANEKTAQVKNTQEWIPITITETEYTHFLENDAKMEKALENYAEEVVNAKYESRKTHT